MRYGDGDDAVVRAHEGDPGAVEGEAAALRGGEGGGRGRGRGGGAGDGNGGEGGGEVLEPIVVPGEG